LSSFNGFTGIWLLLSPQLEALGHQSVQDDKQRAGKQHGPERELRHGQPRA
jgi:hypothetical protein